jgi:hypothetical protein
VREIRWTEESEQHIARHGLLPIEVEQVLFRDLDWWRKVESVDDRDLDVMREHFDSSDLSDAIDSATWQTEVDSDPMIVTSVRLPKSLLDWVREQAAVEQLKPTALIRRWVEDRRRASTGPQAGLQDDAVARLADRVTRLEEVALRVVAVEREAGVDSMTDLLAALQESVEAARGTRTPLPPPDQERRGA